MGGVLCILSPGSCATSLAKSTLRDVFSAMTIWVVSSVQWLIHVAGQVLTSSSEPTTVLRGAKVEFTALASISPLVLLVGLLVSTLQALRHADASMLWRVYFGVAPACVAGVMLARPVALMTLQTVDALCSSAASTVASHDAVLAKDLLALTPSTPGFGLLLLALALAIGTWLLWCELIVRTVVLTLLLVLVPVAVPLAAFPSMRRLGWRLGETFVAVAVSKFLIVVTLVLGLDELVGSSRSEALTGAVTLLLATAAPFLLLRVVPFIEQSAVHNLEGLRSRATRALTNVPSSPAGQLARSMKPDAALPGPPTRHEDLGLDMWPSDGDVALPPLDGDPPPPPIGEPRRRGGHAAYRHDDDGPVVGWHFDE